MAEEFKRTETTPQQETIDMIEKLLKSWNIDPAAVKNSEKNLWHLVQGSAKFHLELFQFNKGPEAGLIDCIEIGGIIMHLPRENPLPLYKKLLELNASSVGVYFAVRNNLVMLLATRELAGIDYNELKTLIDEVRFFSDYWDDILMQEFGGTK